MVQIKKGTASVWEYKFGINAKYCQFCAFGITPNALLRNETTIVAILSESVYVFPWKVLGPGDDNS